MESEPVKTEVKIRLTMDMREAYWLKGYLQNAMCPGGLSKENAEVTKMRASFFESLKQAIEKANSASFPVFHGEGIREQ